MTMFLYFLCHFGIKLKCLQENSSINVKKINETRVEDIITNCHARVKLKTEYLTILLTDIQCQRNFAIIFFHTYIPENRKLYLDLEMPPESKIHKTQIPL